MSRNKRKRFYPPRPFRIWDAVNKRDLPRRCYHDAKRAFSVALLLAPTFQRGAKLEVYHASTGRLVGQVITRARGILFYHAPARSR